jgi:hypothetical protein
MSVKVSVKMRIWKTAFCTLPVAWKGKETIMSQDSYTLFTEDITCSCRSCVDNDTLFLHNIMCMGRK